MTELQERHQIVAALRKQGYTLRAIAAVVGVSASTVATDLDDGQRECKFDGCHRPCRTRGWCSAHYFQWRTTGIVKPSVYDRTVPKRCLVCGAEEWPDNGRRRYCSARCEQLGVRRSPLMIVCDGCGTEVSLSVRPGQRKKRSDTRYCVECSRLRALTHVARSGRRCVVSVAQVRSLGTLCGVCGLKVDYRKVAPDPRRPSIDHIVPRRLGGSDELSNLQITHLICNQRKALWGPYERRGRQRFGRRFFYSSQRWVNLSLKIRRANPICEQCGEPPSAATDHRVSIEAGCDPWDESNLWALCQRCHNAKSQQEYLDAVSP